MSEATYTAWDDNLYEWPPPEGWYQADDAKWWPEGYGPTGEASPADEGNGENPNEALLFEVERTSIFPAGGSGLVGTNQSEDRIEAESQRPVYDELPSIDDVFGGADPYSDESEPANSNGVVAFSGPPPSIDDLPGLSDLEIAGSDDGNENGNGEVEHEAQNEVETGDEANFDGFTVGDEDDIVAERESVDVDSHLEIEGEIEDEIEDDTEGDDSGAIPTLDQDEISPELLDGALADGDLVSDETSDGDLADGDLADGDLADGDLADGDLADGDVADGDVEEGDLAESDVDDVDLADADIGEVDGTDAVAEEADDAVSDGVDADHDEESLDVEDARAEARAGLGTDDPDEAFDQIVENYDSTEAADDDLEADEEGLLDGEVLDEVEANVDGDLDADDLDADEEFDAETMVSGVHLGELPDKLPDPHATAPIASMADADGPQESPLPDVGVHMDALPDVGTDLEDDETSIAATTADVDPRHEDVVAADEVVYGDSPVIGQRQEHDNEVAHYRDDPDVDHEPGRRWWPIVAVAAAAAVVAGLVLFLLFGRGDDGGFDISASLADTRAGSLGEPYSSGTGVVVFYNDDVTGEERRWVIQVVETVADQSDQLVAESGAVAPGDGNVLAVSRIRVTYQSGPAPGQASDLLFTSIGSSLAFFDQGDECTAAEALDLATGLDPGQAIEGNVCWAVPAGDLAGLKLAVEAGPVDGVVFMDLN